MMDQAKGYRLMRSFIVKVAACLLALVVLDFVVGSALDYVSSHVTSGEAGRDNYISDSVAADLLIMGSSKAFRHYNAQMMTDSLGLSCFNCGEGACGILLAYARLQMIGERCHPKHIIYEVTPIYDYLIYDESQRALGRMKLHYGRIPAIDSLLWQVDATQSYKMWSRLYRHNSSCLMDLISLFKSSGQEGVRGFSPFEGTFDAMKVQKDAPLQYDRKMGYQYDSLKIKYFNKFLDLAQQQGSTVTMVVSPIWYGQDTLVLDIVKDICKQRSLPLLDFSNDPKYVHQDQYYSDGIHLNAFGADEFTRDLINELKRRGLQ